MKLQQGDVIIRRIKVIPEGARRVSKTKRGFVLAEGETTGHAHVIEDDVELYEWDGILFVKASKPATIRHEEHKPVTLPKGRYEVRFVREFDYRREEARRIGD